MQKVVGSSPIIRFQTAVIEGSSLDKGLGAGFFPPFLPGRPRARRRRSSPARVSPRQARRPLGPWIRPQDEPVCVVVEGVMDLHDEPRVVFGSPPPRAVAVVVISRQYVVVTWDTKSGPRTLGPYTGGSND
jgi:hypothetical protein